MGCGASTEKHPRDAKKSSREAATSSGATTHSSSRNRTGATTKVGAAPEALAGGAAGASSDKYVDRESLKDQRDADATTTDYESIQGMEADRVSHARETDEPSPLVTSVKHKYRKLKSLWEHGINDDPSQYQDEVDKAVPVFREKDRLRCQRWVNEVILPSERRDSAAAAVDEAKSVSSEGLGASYGSSVSLSQPQQQQHQKSATATTTHPGSSGGYTISSGAGTRREDSSPIVPTLPSAVRPMAMDYVIVTSPSGGHNGPLDRDESRHDALGASFNNSLTVPMSPMSGIAGGSSAFINMNASRTSHFRGMELSTTGLDDSFDTASPSRHGGGVMGSSGTLGVPPTAAGGGAAAVIHFRRMGNFSFEEGAAAMYSPTLRSSALAASHSSVPELEASIPAALQAQNRSPTASGAGQHQHQQQQLPPRENSSGPNISRVESQNSGSSGSPHDAALAGAHHRHHHQQQGSSGLTSNDSQVQLIAGMTLPVLSVDSPALDDSAPPPRDADGNNRSPRANYAQSDAGSAAQQLRAEMSDVPSLYSPSVVGDRSTAPPTKAGAAPSGSPLPSN